MPDVTRSIKTDDNSERKRVTKVKAAPERKVVSRTITPLPEHQTDLIIFRGLGYNPNAKESKLTPVVRTGHVNTYLYFDLDEKDFPPPQTEWFKLFKARAQDPSIKDLAPSENIVADASGRMFRSTHKLRQGRNDPRVYGQETRDDSGRHTIIWMRGVEQHTHRSK